jgi:hypothetical protein
MRVRFHCPKSSGDLEQVERALLKAIDDIESFAESIPLDLRERQRDLDDKVREVFEFIHSLPDDLQDDALKCAFPWYVDNAIASQEGRPTIGFKEWLVRYGP